MKTGIKVKVIDGSYALLVTGGIKKKYTNISGNALIPDIFVVKLSGQKLPAKNTTSKMLNLKKEYNDTIIYSEHSDRTVYIQERFLAPIL